jgi:hypothetical protein
MGSDMQSQQILSNRGSNQNTYRSISEHLPLNVGSIMPQNGVHDFQRTQRAELT